MAIIRNIRFEADAVYIGEKELHSADAEPLEWGRPALRVPPPPLPPPVAGEVEDQWAELVHQPATAWEHGAAAGHGYEVPRVGADQPPWAQPQVWVAHPDEEAAAQRLVEAEQLLAEAQAEADRLVAAAQAEAERIRAEAEEEAARVRDEAEAARHIAEEAAERLRQESAEIGHQEGLDQGRAEGLEQGIAEGRARAEEETAALVARATSLAENAGIDRRELLRNAEAEVVRLAIEIARKVIARELTVDPDSIARIAEAALQHVAIDGLVKLRVHPDDHEALAAYWLRAHGESEGDRSFDVVADPAVAPGGVVIDTRAGTVDAQIETQLEEISQKIFGEQTTVPGAAG